MLEFITLGDDQNEKLKKKKDSVVVTSQYNNQDLSRVTWRSYRIRWNVLSSHFFPSSNSSRDIRSSDSPYLLSIHKKGHYLNERKAMQRILSSQWTILCWKTHNPLTSGGKLILFDLRLHDVLIMNQVDKGPNLYDILTEQKLARWNVFPKPWRQC